MAVALWGMAWQRDLLGWQLGLMTLYVLSNLNDPLFLSAISIFLFSIANFLFFFFLTLVLFSPGFSLCFYPQTLYPRDLIAPLFPGQSAMESLLGASMTGVVYSLFAGQPLTILGSTGPVLVFEKILYKFCK